MTTTAFDDAQFQRTLREHIAQLVIRDANARLEGVLSTVIAEFREAITVSLTAFIDGTSASTKPVAKPLAKPLAKPAALLPARPGRPRGRPSNGPNGTTKAKAAVTAKPNAKARSGMTKRGTPRKQAPFRDAAVLEALGDAILTHVRTHPGATMAEIAKATAISSDNLSFPKDKLLRAGKLRKEGDRAHTRYYAT